MEHDRLIALLRALPPAPEAWVARAREIPTAAAPDGGGDGPPDEDHLDLPEEDPLAADPDPWDPMQGPEADQAPDDPSGDSWLP